MPAAGRSSNIVHRTGLRRLLLSALVLAAGTAALAAADNPQSPVSAPPVQGTGGSDPQPVSCAAVLCPVWTRCVESGGTARCVAFGPACGGKAGTDCPGAGTCQDDPTDDCDPGRGKKKCPSVCRCDAIGLCVEGYRWESSPFVCGCVPEEAVTCGPTVCPVGQVCCNESCGICTEPGGVCIQIACE